MEMLNSEESNGLRVNPLFAVLFFGIIGLFIFGSIIYCCNSKDQIEKERRKSQYEAG